MPTRFRIAALCCVAFAVLAVAGCAKRLQHTLGLSNQAPVVSLTSTFTGTSDAPAARLQWDAADPDGRVDHFLVTSDLAVLRRGTEGWTRTIERERTIAIARRAAPLKAAAVEETPPTFQLFAVRAVDDRGAVSAPAYRAFFGDNVAPTVTIIDPRPDIVIHAQVAPTFTIRWQGSDPDGPDGRVARYKYKLYAADMIPRQWIQYPDSLLAAVAPAFAGWDSVEGHVTEVTCRNLPPGREYLFVITALDHRGAYDPVFSLDKNMLLFYVAELGKVGPRITFFNSTFSYTYPYGGYAINDGPSIEAPANRPITVHWYADPMMGARMTDYRWVLDPAGGFPIDSIQRRYPHDVHHWSAWSLATTSVTFGPFAPRDEQHVLLVEARQTGGLVSMGSVKLHLVSPSFANDLLIVNDTRLAVDQSYKSGGVSTDSIVKPPGDWPSAAELDTFLFAVGGVRWRMTPAGTLSPEGIFKGYRYDTLGTRMGLEDPTIPLSVLTRYRHVVWMVDLGGADFRVVLGNMPMTALRHMSQANRENTLATWVQMGGSLWALGGGFGDATNAPWDNTGNNIGAVVFSSTDPPDNPDLGSGRFMYDLTHWRSQFSVLPKVALPTLGLARVDQIDPLSQIEYPRPATYWTGEPLADPRFSVLPPHLTLRTLATDPLWPFRTSYPALVDLEFLSADNHVLQPAWERERPRHEREWPIHRRERQALDTLYLAFGTSPAMRNDRLPGHAADVNPVMTYYHGRDCGAVVFSGFPLWRWTRADCVTLADFVLGRLWGLSRATGAGGPSAAREVGRGVSRP